MTARDVLARSGRRRLLALDGGGIRGLMTIEILDRIEAIARQEHCRKDLVLADVFDYVAGTSTGAIIASCISVGMAVDDIRRFYRSNGASMFEPAGLIHRLRFWYHEEPLAHKLQEVFTAKATLGSDVVRTLLTIVLRNATTDSPWPISNNPDAMFNNRKRPDCNLDLPLWQLVRASTAAPVYFPPEVIIVGKRQFVFVDGGLTMYNNPAFQLFLMATLKPYRLCWKTGQDEMLLVSVGTGSAPAESLALNPDQMHIKYNLSSLPTALMYAAAREQDFLCRTFGRCLHGPRLDREIRDCIGMPAPGEQKLFTYFRYDLDLSRNGLDALGLRKIKSTDVQRLDGVRHMDDLQRVGKAYAARMTTDELRPWLGARPDS